MAVTVQIGATFPAGTRLSLNDQVYVLLGSEPYTRKSDGQPSTLLSWRTSCPTEGCGQDIPVTTGLRIASASIRRRCPEHTYTGTPAKRSGHKDEVRVELP